MNMGVKLIGTTAETIFKAEDRQAFKDTMEKIGEPVAASQVVKNVEDGIAFTNKIGYPVVLRPALYTRRYRRWNCSRMSRAYRHTFKWTSSVTCRRGSCREMYRRLEGNRVRGNA